MKIPNPTFRELSLASLEKINSLCQRPDWLAARKQILEFSHGMFQDLSEFPDNKVEFTIEELEMLRKSLQLIRFSPNYLISSDNEKWKELSEKIEKILLDRQENKK